MKASKHMLILFLAPALITYGFIYVYPILQTIHFSFNRVTAFAGGVIEFRGLQNYVELIRNLVFQHSLLVLLRWWLVGGILLFGGALMFTLLFMTGIRFRHFWRVVLYGPNIINVVAMTTMWSQYIYNPRYGLLKTFFDTLGLHQLASIQWTSMDMIFWSVLIAYVWGSLGYFFLIILSGVERIPTDLYEVARLDGASTLQVFFRITLPLLRDVIRVAMVMWSIIAINMFAFPLTFAPVNTPPEIVTPPIYLYRLAFGTTIEGTGEFALGKAAAGSCLLLILVVFVAAVISQLLKERREIEY